MLKQKLKQIKSGKLTAAQNVMQFGEKIKKLNKKLNIYLILNKEAINQAKEIDKRIKNKKPVGKLAGLCVAVKSNICVKEIETNCASKVLQNWVAPFNATVIEKLKAEDAIILGMTNMDEFACGWSGETSAFNPTKNPTNPELIPGGSSSGSAAAVAADLCDFALGSDTGGSIRNPATHCGVTGLKPTYGSTSRYGLIDMCMSFDQIGPLTKTPEDAELIFNIIKGEDNFDTTTLAQTTNEKVFTNSKLSNAKGERLGLDKIKQDYKTLAQVGIATKSQVRAGTIGLVNTKNFCNPKIAEVIKQKAEALAKKHNLKIKSVNLPLDIAIQTYYILVYVEFFSATRKFDGRRFGLKIDVEGGPEVQRRILGGSEITKAEYAGKFYRNALKARHYIKEQFEKIFKDVDLLILPTLPITAHKIGDSISIKDMMNYDVLTCLQNIAGLPAISISAGQVDNKHIGLQIIAPWFQEDLIFNMAKKIE